MTPAQASLTDIESAAEAESQVVHKIIQMGSSFELPPATFDRVQLRSDFCSHLERQISAAKASGELPNSFRYQLSTLRFLPGSPKSKFGLELLRAQSSGINEQTHTFDENLSFIVAPDASGNGIFRIVVYSEKDFALLERAETSQQTI